MRTKLILLFTVLAVTASCKKKLTQFYVDYNSSVVIASSFGQLVPFSVYTPEVTTNSEVVFESNNTRKDKIESIYLRDLVLSITSPTNETFSFLNSVEVFISSPNLAERKVAFKEDIPASVGASLTCELVDVDLQSFIKEDQFTIRVETVTDETIPEDVHVNVYSNFFVDAKLLK